MNAVLESVRLIDTDAHVIEPGDVWTSRMPKKWADYTPHITRDPDGQSRWKIGDTWFHTAGYYSRAGWMHYPPTAPVEFSEIESAGYDAAARLKKMDEHGIYAQVIYPNLIGFETPFFIRMEKEAGFAAVRAYNDFLTDFASVDPKRFILVSMIPFWDIEESLKEMTRCKAKGHAGILFANDYEKLNMPGFVDPHWDPIYQAAQDLDMSVNFHVSFAESQAGSAAGQAARANTEFNPRESAMTTTLALMGNSAKIAKIVTSGICDRFPKLKFVSVESGFGYVPYLMDALDWHWKGYGAWKDHPLLPSEYFRRQCYGSLWFEHSTLNQLSAFPDNFMFESDYPHPTSLAPGAAMPKLMAKDYLRTTFADVSPELTRKVLHDNAAQVYNLGV